ncbi:MULTISPECIES: SDR family oxidoreductase [unclassified Mesorhizobium]|uniref:SDR family oxidoreductase n=1 Tax=unclassified Mesorhizobium TaxID=325217 RepID=UPI000FD374D5|nr:MULTISPECIES: SDR family oxidoreductase [unclassified Mesorhizobium]RVB77117.1 SDR family oxidoreductase [Mesorhizobium sp. M6A.T.Cr.TU.014.01.1.1]RWP75991.1 MAG: SDR family oxidoreductase [Mesorhizobium sp.]RWP96638.1 MAG: SDR family oxidoreductase [Mesorhizobium sp.]RWQ10202.1 MAG: SDR family oxidoreductase [Mesorhizobium sp.]
MNILILGATGFIGSAVARKLADEGHQVTGLGRDIARASLKMPFVRWLKADLAGMTQGVSWQHVLDEQQVVVNCAGALQDGLSDDLSATQERAMLALYEAARDQRLLIIQISAETETADRDIPFLSTKRRADTALVASGVRHIILRPALVLGRNAHGGSALLRALAAFPMVIPLVYAESLVTTVALDDVASAVSAAIQDTLPAGSDVALGSDERLTLRELVLLHRSWLGLPAAPVISMPSAVARPVTWFADMAGRLGWRSPLRSTAMAVMSGGIENRRPQDHRPRLSSTAETLAAVPSGVQDLWFARLYLLKSPIIIILALFWLIFRPRAVPHIRGGAKPSCLLPDRLTGIMVVATCLADIMLGLAVLFRPWARRALIGMLFLTFVYLLAATFTEPVLWLDPLGPLVKVVPSILLTLAALAILDER